MTIIHAMMYNPNVLINGSNWSEMIIDDNFAKDHNKLDAMTVLRIIIDALHEANEKNNSGFDIAVTGIEFEG